MTAIEDINEEISKQARDLANYYAQQEIEMIGKYGTEVFDSHANLEGTAMSLTLKFEYPAYPEVEEQLREIGFRALKEARDKNMLRIVDAALSEEIEV